jgi:hypothetical protein
MHNGLAYLPPSPSASPASPDNRMREDDEPTVEHIEYSALPRPPVGSPVSPRTPLRDARASSERSSSEHMEDTDAMDPRQESMVIVDDGENFDEPTVEHVEHIAWRIPRSNDGAVSQMRENSPPQYWMSQFEQHDQQASRGQTFEITATLPTDHSGESADHESAIFELEEQRDVVAKTSDKYIVKGERYIGDDSWCHWKSKSYAV